MDARREEVCKPRIDPRLHPESDEVVASECAAFYCILLGHQHEVACGEIEVAHRPRVVVGERVRHEFEALGPERREEAPRVADSRNGMQAPAPERREGTAAGACVMATSGSPTLRRPSPCPIVSS